MGRIQKRSLLLTIGILLFFWSGLPCFGANLRESETFQEMEERSGIQDLYQGLDENAKEQLRLGGIQSAAVDPEEMEENLLQMVSQALSDAIKGPSQALILLVGIILLCQLCGCYGEKRMGETIHLVGTLACCGVLLPFLTRCFSGLEALGKSLSVLLSGCVPVYGGLLMATGKPQTAMTHGVMTLAAGNAIPLITTGIILPALHLMLAIGIVATVTDLPFGKVSEGIYGMVKWLLILVVTVFFALMSTKTAINASMDEAAAKAAKLVVSSAIPVVGSAVGDALSAIQGSVEMIKSGAGAFGMLAALLILLPGLIQGIVWVAVCWLGQMVAEIFSMQSIAKFLDSILSLLRMLLAVTVSIGAVTLLCISMVLWAGGAS